jgi:hypothetical protein
MKIPSPPKRRRGPTNPHGAKTQDFSNNSIRNVYTKSGCKA